MHPEFFTNNNRPVRLVLIVQEVRENSESVFWNWLLDLMSKIKFRFSKKVTKCLFEVSQVLEECYSFLWPSQKTLTLTFNNFSRNLTLVIICTASKTLTIS